MKYRKKPVTVEAYQTDKELIIHTLEGDMKASVGDYIITGVNGEQYPCKPDIFEKTYTPVINTHFDRIKAMNVKQLAKVISCPFDYDPDFCLDVNCDKCCEKWLESEVQEDDT